MSLRSVDEALEEEEEEDLSPVMVVHSDILREEEYCGKGKE